MADLVADITSGLQSLKPKAQEAVARRARSAILDLKASEILTFVTPSGRRIAPEANPDYAKALIAFVREKPHDGYYLDSAATPKITAATEDALSTFLGSEEAISAMTARLSAGASANLATKEIIQDEAKWIGKEILDTTGVSAKGEFATQLATATADQASALLQTSAGKAIVAGISKAVATSAGKVLITKLVVAAAGKVAASTMLKTLIATIVKKIGVAVLTKAVLIKLVLVAVPALAAVHIPVFWIVAPLVIAFVAYEMGHLPQKLADKLPPEISSKIGDHWDEISRQVAEAVMVEAAKRAVQKAA